MASLIFPRYPEVGHMDELHPETEATVQEHYDRVFKARDGDSNDEEIEALWELIGTLMSALQIKETQC